MYSKEYDTNRKKSRKNKNRHAKAYDLYGYRENGPLSQAKWLRTVDPLPMVNVPGAPGVLAVFKQIQTKAINKILNEFIFLQGMGKPVYWSQKTIAKRTGLAHTYVCACLKSLEMAGFIASYRRENKSKIYKLSSVFSLASVRELLAPYLSNLQNIVWGIGLLASIAHTLVLPADQSFMKENLYSSSPLIISNTLTVSNGSAHRTFFESLKAQRIFHKGDDVKHFNKPGVRPKAKDDKVLLPSEGGDPAYFTPSTNKRTEFDAAKQKRSERQSHEDNYVRGTHAKFKADADRHAKEVRARRQVNEIEAGTSYEKENMDKGNAALEQLWGKNWKETA